MTSAEEQRRQHQATLVELWRKMYDTRVFPPSEDPLHVAGVLSDLVFNNREVPHRDWTAGAGVMPLAHGNEMVAESIRELLKFFYQTAPYGEHIHGVHMEYLRWLVPHFRRDARFLFLASENEALVAASAMVADRRHRPLLAVNRTSVPLGASVYVQPDPSSSLITEEYANRWAGYLVSPLDPDTYEVLEADRWHRILDTAHAHNLPVVWDDTVAGMGWTGRMFTAPEEADFIVLGGALGGGIPLGCVAGPDLTLPSELGGHGNRLGGSALSVTAGLHTLKQVTHRLKYGQVSQLADAVDGELVALMGQFPDDIVRFTGEGLLRGIEFRSEGFAQRFQQVCREDGLLLGRCRNLVRVAVPLNSTPGNVEDAFGVMVGTILKVRESRHGR